MRKTVFYIVLAVVCCTAFSGRAAKRKATDVEKNKYETCTDSASLCVSYTYYYKRDSSKRGYYADPFRLYVHKGKSAFYSYNQYRRDSIFASGLLKGENAFDILEEARQFHLGEEWKVRKNLKNDKYTYNSTMMKYEMTSSGNLQSPSWTIVSDSTKIVAEYPCQLAEATVFGRKWEVWFCPEIPLNEGPWFLWGLPGLILQATDSEKLFSFVCTGIVHYSPVKAIKAYSIAGYIKEMDMKSIRHLEEIKFTDGNEYTKIVADDDGYGPPMPSNPYISLIKTLK